MYALLLFYEDNYGRKEENCLLKEEKSGRDGIKVSGSYQHLIRGSRFKRILSDLKIGPYSTKYSGVRNIRFYTWETEMYRYKAGSTWIGNNYL